MLRTANTDSLYVGRLALVSCHFACMERKKNVGHRRIEKLDFSSGRSILFGFSFFSQLGFTFPGSLLP